MIINNVSVSSGLSTESYIIPHAGQWYLSAQTTMLPPSDITITLSQSGSAVDSIAVNSSEIQDKLNAQHVFNCEAGDVLTVALTSSAAIDQPPNMIKTVVNFRQGCT